MIKSMMTVIRVVTARMKTANVTQDDCVMIASAMKATMLAARMTIRSCVALVKIAVWKVSISSSLV